MELTFLAWSCVPECWQVVDKHLVGYCTIQYMERGNVTVSYDGDATEMEGSWFWPAYPGPHLRFTATRDREPWHHRHVAFRGPVIGRWTNEGLWPAGPQKVEDEGFAARFDELLRLVQRPGEWAHRRAINMLEGMLLQLADDRMEAGRQEKWLAEILSALASDPTFVPDFSSLASRHGMAASTLRRKFKHSMGLSLHDYVILQRISTAKRLLLETDRTQEAIAQHLGYYQPAFFSRQFKKWTGVTPSTFRRSRA